MGIQKCEKVLKMIQSPNKYFLILVNYSDSRRFKQINYELMFSDVYRNVCPLKTNLKFSALIDLLTSK